MIRKAENTHSSIQPFLSLLCQHVLSRCKNYRGYSWLSCCITPRSSSTIYFTVIGDGDTPPPLVRSIQGSFRRYAVRKGLVRSTQKFCYIVRRHQFFLWKGTISIKKHNTSDIQSQITLNKVARSKMFT